MNNELEVKKNSELMTINYEEDAGLGQNFTAQDYAIPYLSILQAMSPQMKKNSGVEGAVLGGIYNTLTKQVIDGDLGVTVVPCAHQKKWVEWISRDNGGGFVNSYDDDSLMATTTPTDKGAMLPNGNFLVETSYYYVLVLSEGNGPQTVVLSMSKTQLKKAKKWNTLMSGIRFEGKNGPFSPPIFATQYKLFTVEETKKGNTWYNWEVESFGKVLDGNVYLLAKKLNAEVEKGILKAKPEVTETHSEEVM